MTDTSPRVSPVPRMALSLEETGQSTSLCSKTVSRLIAEGKLGCVTVGTRRLVPLTEIQRWLDREAASLSDQEDGAAAQQKPAQLPLENETDPTDEAGPAL